MTDPPTLPGLDVLTPVVAPVAERFVAAGYRLYLVGGVVRDLARSVGRTFDPSANDIDLTTDARPAATKELLAPIAEALWAQGERFGTIGATVNGQALEITTHRAEDYDPESRKPMVAFGDDLDEDLSRRDFTINAAAIELPGGTLHDPYGGMEDLSAKVLRTPLSPEVSFTDDPLRMLRAARFLARFSLTPNPELVDAATEFADRLAIVSVERVNDELERLLLVPDPSAGLWFLHRTGLLACITPQFAVGTATDDQRALSVELAGAPGGQDVRRAGMLWPVRSEVGAALQHLRHSRVTESVTAGLVAAAEQGLANTQDTAGNSLSKSTARRLVAAVGADRIDDLCALAANIDRFDPTVPEGRADELQTVLDLLRAEEDLTDLDAPLSGSAIMTLLDIEPGPMVGAVRAHLRELRLDNGPMTAEQAADAARTWVREERAGGHSLPWDS